MVDVADEPRLYPDIDYHLDYQFSAWNGLAEFVDRWPELEDVDREVFQLEWEGITASRLRQLRRWAEEGHFTPRQQVRFQELLAVVTKKGPALARLFAT